MARRLSGWRIRARAAALAALCVLAVQAEATSFNEGADFGNTFATRTVLPDGTDLVNGGGSNSDWIAFDDLVPGSAFSITLTSFLNGSGFGLWDDAQNPLSAGILLDEFTQQTVNGSVPLSGQLVVSAGPRLDSHFYRVTLTAERVVPEPSTALLLGAGIGATALLRRRRRA